LTRNPKKRPNARKALNHAWLKKADEFKKEGIDIDSNLLNNLQNFRDDRKLQGAIWEFFVAYMTSDEDKQNLLETFKALDENGDGMISREELLSGYRKITDAQISDEELN